MLAIRAGEQGRAYSKNRPRLRWFPYVMAPPWPVLCLAGGLFSAEPVGFSSGQGQNSGAFLDWRLDISIRGGPTLIGFLILLPALRFPVWRRQV